jgi:putative inorganic carbon (HCO3(-)) transporter
MQQVQKIDILAPLVDMLPASLTNLPGDEGGFHPNIVAGTMLWVLPLLLILSGWLILKRKQLLQKMNKLHLSLLSFLMILSLLLVAFVFLITQSRTGFIALFMALLSLLVFLLPPKWRVTGLLILFAIVVSSGWLAWGQGWLQVLYEATTPGDSSTSFLTLNSRIGYWSQAITTISSFPFTGIGLNTFETISAYIYPYFSSTPGGGVTHAHNEFLQAALDFGIPGLIAFIAIYFVTFDTLIHTWQRAGTRSFSRHARGLDQIFLSATGIKAFTLGIGLSLLAHALFGFTDAIALGTKPGILFWMLLGLAAGLHALVCNSRNYAKNAFE